LNSAVLFAYGSLASPASAAATLGREVEVLAPARLRGFRRRWSQARDNIAAEKTFARAEDGLLPAFCLGLNLEPAPEEAGPNGALIEVSDAELDQLDVREIRYRRIDVTQAVDAAALMEGHCVLTYVARAENLARQAPDGAVILASYLEAVEAAFDALGPGELALFRETTGPPPVEVIEAELVRDAIPPGNPRSW
jgi:hypothetical protein